MNATLCKAIQQKRVIRFLYDGDLRVVEPFCHGVSTAGHEVLRGYQMRGQSESHELGWKLFTVSEMSGLTITDETFNGVRKFYRPNDQAMTKFFCRVPKT